MPACARLPRNISVLQGLWQFRQPSPSRMLASTSVPRSSELNLNSGWPIWSVPRVSFGQFLRERIDIGWLCERAHTSRAKHPFYNLRLQNSTSSSASVSTLMELASEDPTSRHSQAHERLLDICAESVPATGTPRGCPRRPRLVGRASSLGHATGCLDQCSWLSLDF